MEKQKPTEYQRINFYIIRELWKKFRKLDGVDSLYSFMGLKNRVFYESVINLDNVFVSRFINMADIFYNKTNLNKQFIKGTKMLNLKGITSDEWTEFLNIKKQDYKPKEQKEIENQEKLLKKINGIIQTIDIENCDDLNMIKLIYFIKTKPIYLDIPFNIKCIKRNQLESETVNKLIEYRGALEKHFTLVNNIIKLKELGMHLTKVDNI